jgi:nucleotide-binding universal stress UspA family protein
MSELLGAKVLLATDGAEEADLAAQAATEVAEGTGSELHVVYVEPLPKIIWRVKVAGATVAEAHLRMGAVADEIVGLADELEAGLVVVGSRGLGSITRTLAGSVSERVFRHAHCPVMVVRAKGSPPSRRGGGRPRMRRVPSPEMRRATNVLAHQAK